VIRFSAIVSVVAIALGLLVAGAVSGTLMLVYLAIGVASLALLLLVVGVVIWRDEVFGRPAGDSRDGDEAPAPAACGGGGWRRAGCGCRQRRCQARRCHEARRHEARRGDQACRGHQEGALARARLLGYRARPADGPG
jgi:hypothetical protein